MFAAKLHPEPCVLSCRQRCKLTRLARAPLQARLPEIDELEKQIKASHEELTDRQFAAEAATAAAAAAAAAALEAARAKAPRRSMLPAPRLRRRPWPQHHASRCYKCSEHKKRTGSRLEKPFCPSF